VLICNAQTSYVCSTKSIQKVSTGSRSTAKTDNSIFIVDENKNTITHKESGLFGSTKVYRIVKREFYRNVGQGYTTTNDKGDFYYFIVTRDEFSWHKRNSDDMNFYRIKEVK